ncbi:hypothetical protein [Clavibacter michiganensis]|uniref:hypothetical protein n=1 Tax=Clavibacter michiganensis TaxID=28447 RepID=UPI000A833C38|nr:hypothetical protein [Clavibacter michiganensis]AWF97165.1 hypothetical protein BEH61_01445 [Clavibacter michiganensis subsp. insidiosus]AWG02747.1 hypothetical protein BEH62_14225 [Clavibacter michiganensis subsp. insidiosus]
MLDPAYEVAVVDERRLLLRLRTGGRLRSVLVGDDALIAWWESLVAADPEGAPATLRDALDAVDDQARPTERYVVRDGDRLTPSMRTRPPATRDTSPSPEGGQRVAYVPIERDASGAVDTGSDPDPRAR